jgi:hypothetical protein
VGVEWVADLDATESDAAELGRRAVDALVARNVPEPSPDAALGGYGYPAGPAWADTVERSVSGERPWGVEVRIGRELHSGERTGVNSVTCPRCSTLRTCGAAAPVAEWYADGAALACLGFVFWSWDELRAEVPRRIADVTGGHRVANGGGTF